MSYKVSVLVPIYGVENFIERCARSLFEQTYPDLEYVFVNDCSPDRSVEILKQVMENYPNRVDAVKIINHNTNGGIAAARNTLIDNAVGDYVCYVDSDDWLELDAIERFVKKLMESGAEILSGSYLLHYGEEELLYLAKDYQKKEQWVLNMMQYACNHYIAGRCLCRSLFVENSLRWKEGLDLAEDRYMMTLLSYYAKGYNTVDDVVYHYEKRNFNSITSVNGVKRLENNRQELGNMLALESFFKDKEAVYQRASVRCVMEQLMLNLNVALAYAAKSEFQTIACMI